MTKTRRFFFMTFAAAAITAGFVAAPNPSHAGPGNNGGYPAPGPGNGGGYGK
jgi:hypothetical protein